MRVVNPLGEQPVRVRLGGTTGKVGSFGRTRNLGTKMHNGVDLCCAMGDPIFAPHAGLVRDAGFQRNSKGQRENAGYGLRVYVESRAFGYESVLAHLAGACVATGDSVVAGQLIGFAGRTGNVKTNCPTHLHWGLRKGADWVDPEGYIK